MCQIEQALIGLRSHGVGGDGLPGAARADPLDDLRLSGKSRREKLLAIREMLLMVTRQSRPSLLVLCSLCCTLNDAINAESLTNRLSECEHCGATGGKNGH